MSSQVETLIQLLDKTLIPFLVFFFGEYRSQLDVLSKPR